MGTKGCVVFSVELLKFQWSALQIGQDSSISVYVILC